VAGKKAKEVGMRIGKSIKFIRVAAGIGQKEMARRLGITASYVCMLETNRAGASEKVIRKIMEQFGVPIRFLFLDEDLKFKDENPGMAFVFEKISELIKTVEERRVKDEAVKYGRPCFAKGATQGRRPTN
jgi:transcriptional regulator with XRE-family HTH domain